MVSDINTLCNCPFASGKRAQNRFYSSLNILVAVGGEPCDAVPKQGRSFLQSSFLLKRLKSLSLSHAASREPEAITVEFLP